MQKIAPPVIFITAVAAALFYVSQDEHGTGTLLLLAGVLLVGQICATLPFILDAKKPRAGTPPQNPAPGDGADAQKILANQQIIQDDLRSLGETLFKRLNALAERQNELEKNLPAALQKNAPDLADDFDGLFEKIARALDERRENLLAELDERIVPTNEKTDAPAENLNEKLDAIGEQLDDLLCTVENLALIEDDEEEDEPAAEDEGESESEAEARPEETDEDAENGGDEDEDNGNEDAAGTYAFPENNPNASGDDGADIEDFLENEDVPAEDEAEAEQPSEPEEAPAPETGEAAESARQGELELGDLPEPHGATLILEAMLGIENRPYLRGNAAGLSESAGTPMDYVEIGKWSFDFSPFSEEITVRVLRNDDENDPLGDPVTLSSGQTLELAYVPERRA